MHSLMESLRCWDRQKTRTHCVDYVEGTVASSRRVHVLRLSVVAVCGSTDVQCYY